MVIRLQSQHSPPVKLLQHGGQTLITAHSTSQAATAWQSDSNDGTLCQSSCYSMEVRLQLYHSPPVKLLQHGGQTPITSQSTSQAATAWRSDSNYITVHQSSCYSMEVRWKACGGGALKALYGSWSSVLFDLFCDTLCVI